MNFQELRVGNLIFNHKEQIICVNGLGIDGYILLDKQHNISDIMCKPIPLNEEWLIKFGFSSFEYKTGFIGKDFKSGGMILDFVLTKPQMKGEWQDTFVYDLNDHRFSKVTYVHELQNLFFILTGVELQLSSNVA
jgi:hypothetical protein